MDTKFCFGFCCPFWLNGDLYPRFSRFCRIHFSNFSTRFPLPSFSIPPPPPSSPALFVSVFSSLQASDLLPLLNDFSLLRLVPLFSSIAFPTSLCNYPRPGVTERPQDLYTYAHRAHSRSLTPDLFSLYPSVCPSSFPLLRLLCFSLQHPHLSFFLLLPLPPRPLFPQHTNNSPLPPPFPTVQ